VANIASVKPAGELSIATSAMHDGLIKHMCNDIYEHIHCSVTPVHSSCDDKKDCGSLIEPRSRSALTVVWDRDTKLDACMTSIR